MDMHFSDLTPLRKAEAVAVQFSISAILMIRSLGYVKAQAETTHLCCID